MRTIFIGDIHGDNVWKQIVNKEPHDRVIFIGDYFDSFDISTDDQVNNFLDIMEYKKTSGKIVVCLIGNHDHHYFSSVGNTGTSGYQKVGNYVINPVIEAHKEHLQIAYKFDNILCTHAGVTKTFINSIFGNDGWSLDTVDEDLNELFKYKPLSFCFDSVNSGIYSDPYGDDIHQSPIWVRPKSLQKDGLDKKEIIQVVGHTQQNQIDIKGKSTGGRYFYIDTLRTSGEYLIYENGTFSVEKI